MRETGYLRVKCSRCGTEQEGHVRGDGAVMVSNRDTAEFGCPFCNPHYNWTDDHLRLLAETNDADERARLESGLEEPCPRCGAEMGAHILGVRDYECPTQAKRP